jgi:membrane protein DedA with SNARE-associated domain
MQTGLVHLHNLLRWVILILLVISVIKSYTGWKGGKAFNPGDRKVWLFTMIAAHITLLLGFYQWLIGRIGIITTELPEGVSMMKDKTFRFFWLEHPLSMLIAIALITLGYGMARKPVSDQVKYQKAFRYFLIALILILLVTPWPFREVIGRPLFPGM